jgi:hypothetical protein
VGHLTPAIYFWSTLPDFKIGSSLLTGTVFTPGCVKCGIIAALWDSESRGLNGGNSDSTHGTEGVAIGVVVVSELARIDASRSASSGSNEVNEGSLGWIAIPLLTRDGLDIFILLHWSKDTSQLGRSA